MGNDNELHDTRELSTDAQLMVMRTMLKEHDKMLKGNGSSGMYRTMIEVEKNLDNFTVNFDRRMSRFEKVFYLLISGVALLLLETVIDFVKHGVM